MVKHPTQEAALHDMNISLIRKDWSPQPHSTHEDVKPTCLMGVFKSVVATFTRRFSLSTWRIAAANWVSCCCVDVSRRASLAAASKVVRGCAGDLHVNSRMLLNLPIDFLEAQCS